MDGDARTAALDCARAVNGLLAALAGIAARPTDVMTDPVEVHAVLMALAQLTDRLPETLVELLEPVAARYVAGTLLIGDGPHAGAPAAAVNDLARQLCWAATSAHALDAALERALAVLVWMDS